jgi:uncharacterized protein (DUF58 family)
MDWAPARYRLFLYWAAPLLATLGIATDASALRGLGCALLLLLLVALLQSRRALQGLRAARSVHPNAFEDDALLVELQLENRGPRRAFLLEIDDVFGAGVVDRQLVLEPGPLPPGRRLTLAYRSFCSRGWGEYRIGPLAVSAWDGAGLFQARRLFWELDTLTVFPRVHPFGGLGRLGARPSLSPQDVFLGRPGQSLDYLGARDYRPGDDVRRIHWPATAKRGELIVKEQELDLIPYFTLFLDLDRRGRAGTGRKSTLEYVVRTAASLLWQAAAQGDVVQLIAEGERPLFVPPGRGELHATHALFELVRARQDGRLPMLELLEQHRSALPAGSTAALVGASLELDPRELEEALEALRTRGVRALVFLVNDSSFVPIDRWQLPPRALQERVERLLAVLQARRVPGAILSADSDLAAELARRDLLEAS